MLINWLRGKFWDLFKVRCGYPGCHRRGKVSRQNTAYADDKMNFSRYCDKCQEIVDELWDEEWKQYASSQGFPNAK